MDSKNQFVDNQNGQTFLEFLLLMFVVISMAFIIVSGVGAGIGKNWKAIIEQVSAPTETTVNFR